MPASARPVLVLLALTAACVRTWHFPAPTGGSVDVSFPFVFQSSR
jgi:hypothetical protein